MKIPKQSPLKQIRKFCLDCMGGCSKSVCFCHSLECANWYLRFGMHPYTVINKRGVKYKKLFDKENFSKDAIFCPDKDGTLYKL